jgi:GNAT superfamily N-acetyltransferase
MTKAGLVTGNKDLKDGRRNVIGLSEKGKAISEKLEEQIVAVNLAVEEIIGQTRHNLWEAIAEWEFLLAQKSLFKRVQDQKKMRESQAVQIVPFAAKYAQAYKALNEEWISQYFKMEKKDYQALDHPKEYILDKGGEIFIALYENEPVGACALVKMDDPDYDFELAKMAVSPKAQGKSIGFLLGKAIIERAKARGGKLLYLESNTILKPAISLYHKLGFQKVIGRATPYERCNIQMELKLI